jgi:Fe2+ or Zn2+ uptake regulation protein
MEISNVISALNSELRRQILSALSTGPMTVGQVLEEMRKRTTGARYRETVYRALEKLVDSELVQKYYEKEKGLLYKLSVIKLTIEITKDSLEIKKNSQSAK